jgi:hypothetical protein
MRNRFQSTAVSTICYHAYTAAYAADAIVDIKQHIINHITKLSPFNYKVKEQTMCT